MRFAQPFWLYVAPLVPVLWLFLRGRDRRTRAGLRALLGDMAPAHLEAAHPRRRAWSRFLLLSGLFWLVLAAARPQWGASEVTVTQRGSDVVIALDISNSMLAEDVLPNRIGRAKAELDAFMDRLTDSRVGLVFFAGSAFVQCPLTLDYGTARLFLDMAGPDMLSEQGTALAAALSTARDLLVRGRGDQESGFQAILLVTDGEDLEGKWEDEARKCLADGIRIIPAGVGSAEGGLIPVTDAAGRAAGFMKDASGQVVMSRLDMESLQKLADMGDGSAFRIGVDGLAGDRLFTELQRLGKRELEDRRISAYQERYLWPLLLALVCLAGRLALETDWRARGPLAAAGLLMVLWAAAPGGARAGVGSPTTEAMDKGCRAYAEGDYQQALSEFGTALVMSPDDPRISLALGETLNRLRKYDDAVREFRRTLDLTDDPDLRAEALYNSGTTHLAAGQPEQAVRDLRESLALDPDQMDARLNLEQALRLLRQQQQQQQQQKNDQQKQDQKKQDKQNQQSQKNQQDHQDQQNQDQQQQDQKNPQEQQQQDQQQNKENRQDQQQKGKQDQQQNQQQNQGQNQQQPQPAGADSTDAGNLDREHALQVLKALDRDEQELKRSVEKRLRGGKPRSGKRW